MDTLKFKVGDIVVRINEDANPVFKIGHIATVIEVKGNNISVSYGLDKQIYVSWKENLRKATKLERALA